MSNITHCNECDGQCEDDRDFGWLHVERNNDLLSFGEDPGPWDFCSWTCLAEYGERKKEPRGSDGSGVAYHDQETIWGPLRSGGVVPSQIFPNTREHEEYLDQMRVYRNGDPSSADQGSGRKEPRPRGRDVPPHSPLRRLSQALRRARRL